jgi:NADH dehydrogenase [ubiquinone] 1 alpha subcomplex assembly factor 5
MLPAACLRCRAAHHRVAALSCRPLSTLSAQFVFNGRAKLQQRARAAAAPDWAEYEYLREEVAARLVGRLADITRTFPEALDLGANAGSVAGQLLAQQQAPLEPLEGQAQAQAPPRLPGGVRTLHQLEPCAGLLDRGSAAHGEGAAAAGLALRPRVGALDGAPLPYADASLDLVISSMALHWVNDVPGLLAEARRVLRPDGVFLAAFLGGDTLMELRCVFGRGGEGPRPGTRPGGGMRCPAPPVSLTSFSLTPCPAHTHAHTLRAGNAPALQSRSATAACPRTSRP